MSIDIFGFRALWSPYYLVALLIVTGAYLSLIRNYQRKNPMKYVTESRQVLYFIIAIVLLYVVKGSPVDLLSHIMFSAHMTQMAVLYLLIPPLFIIALPVWLWKKFLDINIAVKSLFTFFTKPLVALFLFNILFSLYHIPLVFDVVKTNMWLHAGYTSLLFITALFMWFPLVNPIPERESLSGLKKIGYIFGSGVLMTPACALIIFANEPIYSTFTDPDNWAQAMTLCVPATMLANLSLSGPEMFSGLPAIEDQQLGGVLMKVIQEIILGYTLSVMFFAWYKREAGSDGEKIDPLPTENLELKK